MEIIRVWNIGIL